MYSIRTACWITFSSTLDWGRAVSDHLCNFPKQAVQHSQPLYAVIGQLCGVRSESWFEILYLALWKCAPLSSILLSYTDLILKTVFYLYFHSKKICFSEKAADIAPIGQVCMLETIFSSRVTHVTWMVNSTLDGMFQVFYKYLGLWVRSINHC